MMSKTKRKPRKKTTRASARPTQPEQDSRQLIVFPKSSLKIRNCTNYRVSNKFYESAHGEYEAHKHKIFLLTLRHCLRLGVTPTVSECPFPNWRYDKWQEEMEQDAVAVSVGMKGICELVICHVVPDSRSFDNYTFLKTDDQWVMFDHFGGVAFPILTSSDVRGMAIVKSGPFVCIDTRVQGVPIDEADLIDHESELLAQAMSYTNIRDPSYQNQATRKIHALTRDGSIRSHTNHHELIAASVEKSQQLASTVDKAWGDRSARLYVDEISQIKTLTWKNLLVYHTVRHFKTLYRSIGPKHILAILFAVLAMYWRKSKIRMFVCLMLSLASLTTHSVASGFYTFFSSSVKTLMDPCPFVEEMTKFLIAKLFGSKIAYVASFVYGYAEATSAGLKGISLLAHGVKHASTVSLFNLRGGLTLSIILHYLHNFLVIFSGLKKRSTRRNKVKFQTTVSRYRTYMATYGELPHYASLFATPAVCAKYAKNVLDNPALDFSQEGRIKFQHTCGEDVIVNRSKPQGQYSVDCKPRLGAVCVTIGLNNLPWTFYACQHNELHAIVDRFMYWRHPVTTDLVKRFNKHILQLPFEAFDPYSVETTPGAKAKKYTLERHQDKPHKAHHHTNLVKVECNDKPLSDAVPRLVASSTASSNFWTSPLIHHFAKEFVRYANSFDFWYCPYFDSPDDLSEGLREKWRHFETFVSLDGKRMDSSIHPSFNDYLVSVLQKYPNSEESIDYIMRDRALFTQTRPGKPWKYDATSYHGISTGVQWTTMNHCVYLFVSWIHFLDTCPKARPFLVLNKGDDIWIGSPYDMRKTQKYVERFREFLTEQGLLTTVEYTSELFASEFLSNRMYLSSSYEICLVPKIGRLLSKLGWCAYATKISDPYEYAYAVGSCFIHLVHLPIVGTFVRKLLELGREGRAMDILDPNFKYKTKGSSFQDPGAYRVHLRVFYGLSDHEIDEIDKMISSIRSFPCFIKHSSFNLILEKDWFINSIDLKDGVYHQQHFSRVNHMSMSFLRSGLLGLVNWGPAEVKRNSPNPISRQNKMYNLANCMEKCGADSQSANLCVEAIEKGLITEEGLLWLMSSLCTNPSSGKNIRSGRLPGSTNSLDTIRTVKRTITVSRPATFTQPEWHFTTFFMPFLPEPTGLSELLPSSCSVNYVITNSAAAPTAIRPGWNCFIWEGTADWYSTTGVVSTLGLGLLTDDCEGPTILVGTSAVATYSGQTLLRSGNMSCATLTGRAVDFAAKVGTDPSVISHKNIYPPAGNQSQLLRFSNSATWAAPHGFYAVPAMYDTSYFTSAGEPYPLSMFPVPTDVTLPREGWSSLRTGASVFHGGNVIPWNVPQVIMTGLSAGSEYTIVVTYRIQSTPSINETDEIVFAEPPPPMDMMALKLYSIMTTGQSMIFPFHDNPSGAWFGKIASQIGNTLKKLARPGIQHTLGLVGTGVGTLLGNPALGAATGEMAGTLVGDFVDDYLNPPEDQSSEEPPDIETPIVSEDVSYRTHRNRGRRRADKQLTKENSSKDERRLEEAEGALAKVEEHPLPQRGPRRRRGNVRKHRKNA